MKKLKSILTIGALLLGSVAYAEVTTVYSIDYTQDGATPIGTETYLTCDTENGLTYTYPGSDWVQFDIANNFAVEEGKFYTVKILAKAETEISCNTWTSPFEFTFSAGTEWNEMSAVVQALSNNGNVVMRLQPGTNNNTIHIKTITITTGDEGYDPDLMCLQATNIVKKSNPWDNQVNYSFDTPFEAGTYTIAFDYYGTNDGKFNIWGGYALKTDPEEDYLRNQWGGFDPTNGWYGPEVSVESGKWQHYEYTFTTSATGKHTFEEEVKEIVDGEEVTKKVNVEKDVYQYFANINFCLGNNFEGDFYLDNVVFVAQGSDENQIPNSDFKYLNLGKWSKGWQHTFDLAIANGPEHPVVTRTADANSLWFGEKKLGWGDGVTIDASVFADLHYGDKLKFEYGDDRYIQIIYGGWADGNCNTSPWDGKYTYTHEDGKSYAEIEINESLTDWVIDETHYNAFELLKTRGLALQAGGNYLYEIIYIPANKVAFVDAENSISFKTNYAGKEDEEWVVNNFKLTDGARYMAANDFTAKRTEYTRNFTHDGWQAIYLPYDLAYSEWSDKVELAAFYDVVEDGAEINIVWEKVTSGDLVANTPYIVKPLATGETTFVGENKSVKATEETSVTNGAATVYGVYKAKTGDEILDKYALYNGDFWKAKKTHTVNPFRIYLQVSNAAGAPQKIKNIIGEETVNSIDGLVIENSVDGTYYDVMGRKVTNPTCGGIYIQNNKKVIIR